MSNVLADTQEHRWQNLHLTQITELTQATAPLLERVQIGLLLRKDVLVRKMWLEEAEPRLERLEKAPQEATQTNTKAEEGEEARDRRRHPLRRQSASALALWCILHRWRVTAWVQRLTLHRQKKTSAQTRRHPRWGDHSQQPLTGQMNRLRATSPAVFYCWREDSLRQ